MQVMRDAMKYHDEVLKKDMKQLIKETRKSEEHRQ
jgi:hypothetical protein